MIVLLQLYFLLRFLRHKEYVMDGSGHSLWVSRIVKPLEQQREDGWEHLLKLLREILVRHGKVRNKPLQISPSTTICELRFFICL